MYFTPHALAGSAAQLPINDAQPVINFSPVVLSGAPNNRPVDLQLRVAFPASTTASVKPLPILLLAHGMGNSNSLSSLEGYAPLVEFWASHGFAVLQPTFLASKTLSIPQPKQGDAMWWESRAEDMSCILDNLDTIESAVPGLCPGKSLDRDRVCVAGHSFGGFTASMLLGVTNRNRERGNESRYQRDPRIKAGLLLGATGQGGADVLDGPVGAKLPFYDPDFSTLTSPALVVYGTEDVATHFTTKRGADWHGDAYSMAPGPKDLFVVKGAKHLLGGISGFDAAEAADDESPEILEAVRRVGWAYLMSQLYPGEDDAWAKTTKALAGLGELGWVESKKE